MVGAALIHFSFDVADEPSGESFWDEMSLHRCHEASRSLVVKRDLDLV